MSASALASSGCTVTTRVALGARFSRSKSFSSSSSDRAEEVKELNAEDDHCDKEHVGGDGRNFRNSTLSDERDDRVKQYLHKAENKD